MVSTRKRLAETFPAVPASVFQARHLVSEFACRVGLPQERLDGLRLALSEAVTNAVRHAYDDGDGTIWIDAGIAGDELWVHVADRGRGHQLPSPNPGLGFGLGIIAAECDVLTVAERAEGGTELQMRFFLDSAAGRRPQDRD